MLRVWVVLFSIFIVNFSYAGDVGYSRRQIEKDLQEAVEENNLSKVKELLRRGANENGSVFHEDDDDYGSILGIAIGGSNLEIIELLLESGGRVDVEHPGDHKLPIEISLERKDMKVTKLVSEFGKKQSGSLKRFFEVNYGRAFCAAAPYYRDPSELGAKEVLATLARGSDIIKSGEVRPNRHYDASLRTDNPDKESFETLVFIVTQTCINLTNDKDLLLEFGRTCLDVDPRFNGLNYKCNQ